MGHPFSRKLLITDPLRSLIKTICYQNIFKILHSSNRIWLQAWKPLLSGQMKNIRFDHGCLGSISFISKQPLFSCFTTISSRIAVSDSAWGSQLARHDFENWLALPGDLYFSMLAVSCVTATNYRPKDNNLARYVKRNLFNFKQRETTWLELATTLCTISLQSIDSILL